MPSQTIDKSDAEQYARQTLLYFLVPEREGGRAAKAGELGKAAERGWAVGNLPLPSASAREGRPSRTKAASPLFTAVRDLYDVKGRHLFRDLTVTLADKGQLRVRTAADRRLRSPVWSLSVGPTWDVETALEEAERVASRRRLKAVKGKKRLVCYSYPKLGLLCTHSNGSKVVIDLGHLEPVETSDREGAASPELLAVWSPFDAITTVEAPRRREVWSLGTASLPEPAFALEPAALDKQVEGARAEAQQKVLSGMTVRGQETQFYCAVATGQMILSYHGINCSQTQIAAAMKTDSSGTTNENQVAGYQRLTQGKSFTVKLLPSPSFTDAKNEINKHDCPLKSGVPGHARACAGWKTSPGASGTEKQWLYIYDPWPPGQGEIYWEDWASVNHTNFIFVHK